MPTSNWTFAWHSADVELTLANVVADVPPIVIRRRPTSARHRHCVMQMFNLTLAWSFANVGTLLAQIKRDQLPTVGQRRLAHGDINAHEASWPPGMLKSKIYLTDEIFFFWPFQTTWSKFPRSMINYLSWQLLQLVLNRGYFKKYWEVSHKATMLWENLELRHIRRLSGVFL